MWKHRIWLLFVVPFALACWKPLQNSYRNWGNPDSLLLFQSLVPFAVALLIWQERQRLQALWIRLKAYPVTDKRRRGNLIALSLGCLIVLIGHLVYVDSFFGIGLLLILAGTIYYIYGGVILRAIAGPLSLLLLMVNPPDSVISKLSSMAISGTAFATSSLLSLLGKQTSVNQAIISFPNHAVEVTHPLNGANLLAALLFVAFVSAWYQRRTPLYTFSLMVLTALLVVLVHLIRVSLYALTIMGSPAVATLLLKFSPWLLILLLGAVIIYSGQSLDLIYLRMRASAKHREKYGTKRKGLSRLLEEKLLDPMFKAADKKALDLTKKHRALSKSVNAFFKKLIPASKNKRRSRW